MMRWPLDSFTISQGYHADHQAYDLAAPAGTPVKSPVSGVVVSVGTDPNYYGGLFVIIRADSDGFKHYTGHHSRVHVSVGQRVSEGQHIADVGMTGAKTGPNKVTGNHVHYQVREAYSNDLVPQTYYAPLFNAPTGVQGDKPMTPQEENEAYLIVLERPMEHGGSGRTGLQFIRDAKAELAAKRQAVTNTLNALNARIAEMQAIINDLSARPTKEEYAKAQADKLAEITELRNKLEEETAKPPKEVIKQVEVEKPTTWQSVINFLKEQVNKLLGRGKL